MASSINNGIKTFSLYRCLGVIAALCAFAGPALGAEDWIDTMPSVATVAQVVQREYNHGPDDQDRAATNLATALVLLRQIIQYQADEEPATMSLARQAKVRALEKSYLMAELAIGQGLGKRRGALTVPEVHRFYQSRRYEQCATRDCYYYWMRFQLDYWNAYVFRKRILPLLFPCDQADRLIALATKNALTARAPHTPAAPEPEDALAMAQLPRPATAPCPAEGYDLDGDGLCADWEMSLGTKVPARAFCGAVKLDSATTTDARSITVRYTVGVRLGNDPVHLSACRSSNPAITKCEGAQTKPIGEETLSDPALLTPGAHEAVILKDHVLAPDPAMPYVVVVADAAGQTSQTYFRKWLMGVVVHGYTFRDELELAKKFDGLFETALHKLDLDKIAEDALREKLLDKKAVEDWQLKMEQSLKSSGCYDTGTFAYNWRFDSIEQLPSLLTARARELYAEVARRALDMSSRHEGDVVDVHFIGHSRGTVIISEALKEWKKQRDPALKGSYLRVTLLDPHPANNAFSPQEDVEASYLGGNCYVEYRDIQDHIKDPAIELPDGIGIREVQVWFQHSRVKDIKAAPDPDPDLEICPMNLWGLGASTDYITGNNASKVPITWHRLTNKKLANGAIVDHHGVVTYFQEVYDDSARPGKCVLPPR